MQAYITSYVTAIGVACSLLSCRDAPSMQILLSCGINSRRCRAPRAGPSAGRCGLERLESVERVKDVESGKPRVDELAARLQKLESKLAKLEDGAGLASTRADVAVSDAPKATKPGKSAGQGESSSIVSGMPGITPTSAFNLAYNDFLNGKYDLAVSGFQRFTKDFAGTSLTPNAHYWLGESLYNQKDYARATTTFEYLVAEYPGNEKVSAALYKLGLATAETGDLVKSRKYLKRVIEEFPASDEAKLAKNKLADIR